MASPPALPLSNGYADWTLVGPFFSLIAHSLLPQSFITPFQHGMSSLAMHPCLSISLSSSPGSARHWSPGTSGHFGSIERGWHRSP